MYSYQHHLLQQARFKNFIIPIAFRLHCRLLNLYVPQNYAYGNHYVGLSVLNLYKYKVMKICLLFTTLDPLFVINSD